MTPSFVEPDTLTFLLFAAGGSLLGLVGLLGSFARLTSRGPRFTVLPPLVVAALGGAAGAAGLPRYAWLPPLGLAALWAFIALALSPLLCGAARLAASLVRYPRLHWGPLVLAGPAL